MTDTIRITRPGELPVIALPPEPADGLWIRPVPDTGERWERTDRKVGRHHLWASVRGRTDGRKIDVHGKPLDADKPLPWPVLLMRLGDVRPVDPSPPPVAAGTRLALPDEPPDGTVVRADPDTGYRWQRRGNRWHLHDLQARDVQKRAAVVGPHSVIDAASWGALVAELGTVVVMPKPVTLVLNGLMHGLTGFTIDPADLPPRPRLTGHWAKVGGS